jgi:hypothetical protein
MYRNKALASKPMTRIICQYYYSLLKKISFEALKEIAEAIASEELLESISGGIMHACHDSRPADPVRTVPCDNV